MKYAHEFHYLFGQREWNIHWDTSAFEADILAAADIPSLVQYNAWRARLGQTIFAIASGEERKFDYIDNDI